MKIDCVGIVVKSVLHCMCIMYYRHNHEGNELILPLKSLVTAVPCTCTLSDVDMIVMRLSFGPWVRDIHKTCL